MKTKIISLLLLVLLALAFTSCSQDVIFYDIAREEKLNNPEINGNVYSLVPLNGKLYVQNGSIYEKATPQTAHGWTKTAKPSDSSNIIRLATDDACLYAMDENATVWAKAVTDTDWTKIAENVKALFDNQVMDDSSFTTTGRSAYITDNDSSVKKLSGTAAPAAVTATDTFAATAASGDYIKAAVYDGSNTIFSSNAIICAQGTALYSLNTGSKVIRFSTDGGANWTNSGSVDDTAMSICPYGTDKILVGTANGYQISTIDSTSKAASAGVNSTTNAESLISSNRQIIMIKAFGTTVYAGVISDISSQYNKLWGWFGSSWNYE